MATGTIKSTYYKREKLIFGNFIATEVIADTIYFKIPALEDFPITATLTTQYLDTTQQNTTNGMNITNGANVLVTGFTFDDPYIGGQRSVTIRANKTSHGLTPGVPVLNIPPSKAIKVTY